MRTFKRHDEDGLEKLHALWGDDHAYGLMVRENIEQLEKVLQDDDEDLDEEYRDALERLRGAEYRRLGED
jgi:hypothetical protein